MSQLPIPPGAQMDPAVLAMLARAGPGGPIPPAAAGALPPDVLPPGAGIPPGAAIPGIPPVQAAPPITPEVLALIQSLMGGGAPDGLDPQMLAAPGGPGGIPPGPPGLPPGLPGQQPPIPPDMATALLLAQGGGVPGGTTPRY